MIFFSFKVLLIFFSASSAYLSLIFLVSPAKFKKIEKFLEQEFGGGSTYVTVLEGEIDFVNVWVFNNRYFFGPLFIILAVLNTWNAFFL